MDGVSGRIKTGRGTEAERWLSCHSSEFRCAMSTSRSHIAAAARAKRSAESKIGECPVVDMTVDVEGGSLDAG